MAKPRFEENLPPSLQPEGVWLSPREAGCSHGCSWQSLAVYSELSRSCPESISCCCCVHWKLSEDQVQPLFKGEQKTLWILQVICCIHFFSNTYLSYLWHLQQISSKEESLVPDVPQRKHKLFLLFSSS